MLTRRRLVKAVAAGLAASGLPLRLSAAQGGIAEAIAESALIYLTPIQSNGKESRCQSEIWFASDEMDMFVCTGTTSWRATAPTMGLNTARIWVGDLGNWLGTKGKYKALPQLETTASIITDKAEQDRILGLFGSKYYIQWAVWGRRFRDGLADGSRTMIRYRPV